MDHHAGVKEHHAGVKEHQTGKVPAPCVSAKRTAPRRVSARLAMLTASALLVAGCAGANTTALRLQGAGVPATRHSQSGGAEAGTPQAHESGSNQSLRRWAGPQLPAGMSEMAARAGVIGGALFGGNMHTAQLAGKLGRKLAIVRVYYRIGEHFPWPGDRRLMAGGSTLLVSMDTTPGGATYASIAAGRHDAAIMAFLREVDQSAVAYHLAAIYLCFEHEVNDPGEHRGLGSPAQFVAAWDHIHQLAVSAHLDWNQGGRLHWVWILSHTGYTPLAGRRHWQYKYGVAQAFFPGPSEVDIVAVDGYNSADCMRSNFRVYRGGEYIGPGALFTPTVDFARTHGDLPVFVSEWGSISYSSPRVQSQFISDMQSEVAGSPQIAAALYWSGHNQAHPSCNYDFQNNPASIAALSSMGRSAALQGRVGA